MTKRVLTALLLAVGLTLTACGGSGSSSSATPSSEASASSASSEAPASSDEAPQEQPTENITIKVAGSTSVAPLMKELKEAYEQAHSNVTIEIQESGSSAGITATIGGAADLGMSSRDLKDDEISQGLVPTEIALDGIAVILHPENPVSDLTTDQIASIYSGDITDWSEVGGEAGEIILYSREEGSGTRGAFEELLGLEEISDSALFENSTGAVKTNVAGAKTAIGYISLGSMDDSVKAVDVGGVTCSVDNVKNKSYTIARPFLVCTVGEPEGGVKALVDFILSGDGQAIVVENNYITVD